MSKKQTKKQKPITFAHLVNPFKCEPDNPSYIYYAQPITFETMRMAKERVEKQKKTEIKVKLCAITFPEDDDIVPSDFIKLPNLKHSTLTRYKQKAAGRKLPFVQEMINKLKHNIDADYYILTNIDISVKPNFYKRLAKIIRQRSLSNFTINRRNDLPKFRKIKNKTNKTNKTVKTIKIRLSTKPEDLQFLFTQKGTKHPGNDCFVINKKTLDKIRLGDLYTGFAPWGTSLVRQLQRLSSNRFSKLKHEHITFHIGKDNPRRRTTLTFLKKQNFENGNNCEKKS